jgi:pyridoxine 5-phosphate synthase
MSHQAKTIGLGVNIDHVATVRQARYRDTPDSSNAEPCPVMAALEAESAGACCITAHLRADRRHIQDRDLYRLRELITTRLNLEMGNTPEIVEIALDLSPADVCLVPEHRAEVTTEGGLDCVANRSSLAPVIARLQEASIRVSLFIDPDPGQVRMASELGAPVIELHTGAFANAGGEAQRVELQRLTEAAVLAHSLGIVVNAGHGINYQNAFKIRELPHLIELNIGHSIVSRAIQVGIKEATREMFELLNPDHN